MSIQQNLLERAQRNFAMPAHAPDRQQGRILRLLHAEESCETGNPWRLCAGALEWLARSRRTDQERPQSHDSCYSISGNPNPGSCIFTGEPSADEWSGRNRIERFVDAAEQLAVLVTRRSMELKLYSREWCSWCIDAKDFLAERGYNFTEIDVGRRSTRPTRK